MHKSIGRGREKNHLPFNSCILEVCRLRISALGAHIPTCQALDLPTEFNLQDAPTLVSGLPKAISGLLQFAEPTDCTHSPGREAGLPHTLCQLLPKPLSGSHRDQSLVLMKHSQCSFLLKFWFFLSLCFHSYFLHLILATPHFLWSTSC